MSDDLELRHLRYFVAVAEELHFGRAAERLKMAQPPLSQQVQRMERQLGYALFTRSTRGVALTAAGEALLPRAKQALARVADDWDAVGRVARGEAGRVTLGFAGSLILTQLPVALRRFRKRYPDVELRLRELVTVEQMKALIDGEIDFGLARDPEEHRDLIYEVLLEEPFVAVLPVKHPLASRRALTIEDLKDEPFVMFPTSKGPEAFKRVLEFCALGGFAPRIVQEAPHWQTVVRLVEAGFGVSLAPRCVSRQVWKGVVYRAIRPLQMSSKIAIWERQGPRPPAVRALIEVLKEAYR